MCSQRLESCVHSYIPDVTFCGETSLVEAGEPVIKVYKDYSPLDSLNRCGVATACLGPETLAPEGERRKEIGHVQPSGWHSTCYEQSLVAGESLYNRTHLIAWCLCEEIDNPQNLITGTQYLNQRSMQPLENRVVDYIRQSGNHVLYRVTPVFQGEELVARGVQMEARSVEDDGAGISFNVYCYNVQPGVMIDYATGESCRSNHLPKSMLSLKGYLIDGDDSVAAPEQDESIIPQAPSYALNFVTRRFHLMTCRSVKDIAARNEGFCRLDRDMLANLGYVPCGHCKP